MSEENDLIVVYAGTSLDANFVKSLLENHGITAFLKDEIMGDLAPWYVAPGGAGAVKIVIAKRELNKAKPIVQNFLDERSSD
ncbi:DUF2007 domain-containing protein [bacterium]|nr:DUF2007 domain-containing protein [bacterium]MCK4326057.1 DUF2007 domain-containing protein [bacterium]